MATNFPTSLDNFTNPVSGNTLDSPSHSLQHSDANDAIEAIEAKLGVGASPAGSATAGQVLTISAAGTSVWSTPITSGLVLLNTTSFAGVASQSLSANLFSSSYDHYRIILNNLSASSGSPTLRMRLRASGTDATDTDYGTAGLNLTVYTTNSQAYVAQRDQTSFELGTINTSTTQNRTVNFDLFSPFLAKSTALSGFSNFIDDATYLETRFFGGQHELETSYDSITFLASSGNITGTVSVYGYNK